MTFAKKIFIAVFLSTVIVGSALIFSAYKYTITRSEADFTSRYRVFSRVLADTLNRLDVNTEVLMMNAAKVVSSKDFEKGLLSTDELRSLQRELGITHLFLTDKNGTFVRSTNDDPAGIPNLYSFCSDYKKLITGESNVEATPIIKPNPEPKPFKFLSIPNANRNRIVEVGVRVDFIANTLVEAIKSDKNVVSMSLFAPDGTPFGNYTHNNVVFESQKGVLPASFNDPVESENYASFFTKVISSHPRCCQCDIAGTSKNGEYYYVLESKISKADLKALQANSGITFLLIGIGNALLALILARFLSRRLVRNIEKAVERVRSIKISGKPGDRIGMVTNDEISFLTSEFDHLLDSLEESQAKLLEAEKVKIKVDLARVIAHNIKSPVLAIEMMLPGLFGIPESMKRVLKASVREIKQLTEKLKTQSDTLVVSERNEMDTSLIFLPIFVNDLIAQKQLEYLETGKFTFDFKAPENQDGYFVKASSVDLKSILSNLINNACESYSNRTGSIEILIEQDINFCRIIVKDCGAGIPEEYLSQLGTKLISFKGEQSRGLGLVHAFNTVKSWGGKIEILSAIGKGTSVTVVLPRYFTESKRTNAVSVADAPSAP